MFGSASRWFDESSIASTVEYVVENTTVAPALDVDTISVRKANQRNAALFALLGSTTFLAVVIGMLVAFAKPVPGKKPDYVRLGVLSIFLVAGVTGGAYAVSGASNSKRAEREAAIRRLCARAKGFHFSGRQAFNEDHVGSLPWFVSEEWIHTFGLMIGKLRSSQFCLVECDHIIDPMMATTDSKLMQGALLIGKHKRLFRREFEAIVFTKRLENVPDLLIVPKRDPSRGYFRRALDGQHCDLSEFYDLPKEIAKKYFLASANPEACGEHLSGDLLSLLASQKWCTVQVVGGYCCVMTAQWHGSRPIDAPRTETEIADNIRFAGKVYDLLRSDEDSVAANDGEDSIAAWESSYNDSLGGESAGGVATMVAPTAHASASDDFGSPEADTQKATRRRRHSLVMLTLLFGFGAPLMVLGGLCAAVGMVDLHRAKNSADWPQVNGVVMYSAIETKTVNRRGQEVCKYRPEVRYAYTVDGKEFISDRIAFGQMLGMTDKTEVETLLAKYPLNGNAAVYYHPNKPSVSSLKPGLHERSNAMATTGVCAGMFGFGLLLCYYGAAGRKLPV